MIIKIEFLLLDDTFIIYYLQLHKIQLGIKKCLTNCIESDNKFHNVGSHECISKCVDSFSYHKAGGDECMI